MDEGAAGCKWDECEVRSCVAVPACCARIYFFDREAVDVSIKILKQYVRFLHTVTVPFLYDSVCGDPCFGTKTGDPYGSKKNTFFGLLCGDLANWFLFEQVDINQANCFTVDRHQQVDKYIVLCALQFGCSSRSFSHDHDRCSDRREIHFAAPLEKNNSSRAIQSSTRLLSVSCSFQSCCARRSLLEQAICSEQYSPATRTRYGRRKRMFARTLSIFMYVTKQALYQQGVLVLRVVSVFMAPTSCFHNPFVISITSGSIAAHLNTVNESWRKTRTSFLPHPVLMPFHPRPQVFRSAEAHHDQATERCVDAMPMLLSFPPLTNGGAEC